jgi:hypothetical protein
MIIELAHKAGKYIKTLRFSLEFYFYMVKKEFFL